METYGIASDLHLEFIPLEKNWKYILELLPTADNLLLVGDVTYAKTNLKEALKKISGMYNKVIYVVGNHELYRGSFDLLKDIKEFTSKISNLYFLDNEIVKIGENRFVGLTMFPKLLPENRIYEKNYSDFFEIKDFRAKVNTIHAKSEEILYKIKTGDIVLSHHLPSYRSVSTSFTNSTLNVFFVSDQTEIIIKRKPKYWIHGHTHDSIDYTLFNTRVLCNPIGYINSLNKEYRRDLVLKL